MTMDAAIESHAKRINDDRGCGNWGASASNYM
jgi:hypothetical protein